MSTVNISLPEEQVNLIDRIVSANGFANRSEFIRALIRLVTKKPELIESVSSFPFISPSERSGEKILNDFKKSKKYSKAFLTDLEKGLKESNYFDK